MEGNREASPDWLRTFQAPVQTFTTLSSSSPSNSPSREVHVSSRKQSNATFEEEEQQSKLEPREKGQQTILLSDSGEDTPKKPLQKPKATKGKKKGEPNTSMEGKSSLNQNTVHVDAENQAEEEKLFSLRSKSAMKKVSPRKKQSMDAAPTPKVKSEVDVGGDSNEANGTDPSMLKVKRKAQSVVEKVAGDDDKGEVGIDDAIEADEDLPEKRTETRVSSRLPLVFADKIHRSKALLECEGEALDFSGDIGAVGRLIVNTTSTEDHEILLDLKGTIYKTTIVPSHTFCIVNFGQSEAKIEAIMDDFVQLQPHSNVYETETMVEGTLDGFLFDSDDEGDKMNGAPGLQLDQKNEAENIGDEKPTKKSDKASVGTKRKAKPTGKPVKKGAKKSSAAKKPKTAKK